MLDPVWAVVSSAPSSVRVLVTASYLTVAPSSALPSTSSAFALVTWTPLTQRSYSSAAAAPTQSSRANTAVRSARVKIFRLMLSLLESAK